MSDLSQVAVGLLRQGDLDGALAMFEYALGVRVAAFGEDDPSIATELANLGNLLAERHDLVSARGYLERALALHERAFGQKKGPKVSSVALTKAEALRAGRMSGAGTGGQWAGARFATVKSLAPRGELGRIWSGALCGPNCC